MKVYRYIFFKALLSVLGVTLIISLIDISFNFFSQIEDISSSYPFSDALVFVFMSQPFRTREFLYLCIVVGLLATFIDQRFLRSINVLRQAGLKKFNLALLLFFPLALINFSTFEFLVPDLTKDAFEFRKSKVESSSKEPPIVIEIKGDIQNGFQIVSEKVHVKFGADGSVKNDSQETENFKNLNFNTNLKYLTFSELYASTNTAFENFNLVVKTELLRRSLNFISYFFIFLIGLEILFSFNKALNANRIFVYGFGACLFYSFIEKMILDSIDVFSLPYLIQAFPILLIPVYILLRRRYFFS